MLTRRDPPLRPRQGLVLQVLAICRISTDHQDERSLADQEALYHSWLRAHTDLQYALTTIAGRGTGENLERTEYVRALELIDRRRPVEPGVWRG
jgi:site-specific DNA recombinase